MSDHPTREYAYTTEVIEERTMADVTPTVYVHLIETVTTTTRHTDGSTTVHETQPRVVASWTHKTEEPRP